MGHFGDSGSGALIREGGDLYIAGVKSHGENGHWGSSHAYTRAGGELTRPWIEANLASLDERVPVESCEAYEIYGEGEPWFGDEANGEDDYNANATPVINCNNVCEWIDDYEVCEVICEMIE